MNNLRVAWLLPVTWFYWQPMLSEFKQNFSQTKVFTALFPGYSQGYENSLDLQIIGDFKVLKDKKKLVKPQYGSGYTALSPKVVFPLLKYKPDLIFTSSFGLWTLLALLFKPLGRWQIIIAYEGSSPGVDFRNSPLRLGIRKLMVKAADAYITNSKAGKDYLIDCLEAKPQLVFAHPYEVPSAISLSDNMTKNKLNISLKKPVFLFVGRIMRRKGLHLLLDACQKLKQQGIENYSLLIVGEGEQRKELEAFCQEHQLQNCVRWMGKVDYQDISAYFQAADVFILPTVEDTWGVVTLEVMLFGKPVLCSTGAGSSELVIDGENGYVFEPHEPKMLAQLMQKFINKPDSIATMGEQSRRKIAAYTPKKAAEFLASSVSKVRSSTR